MKLVSLGTKLALSTVAVLGVVSTLVFVQLTMRAREGLIGSKQTAAMMVSDLFASGLSAPVDFADQDAVQEELAHLKSNPDVLCAVVFDEKATMARYAAAGWEARCEQQPTPNVADLGVARVFDDRIEIPRAIVGRAGTPIGKTVLVFSLAAENAAYAAVRGRIFWLSFALAAGTALLLLAIARMWIVRPLARLGAAARRVGKGDLQTRVEVSAHDEIGELGEALDAMRLAIGDRENRLEAATQNLRDLFDHMRQAIIAFGPDGRVQGASSREAKRVFPGLEGQSVRTLLYGDAEKHELSLDAQAFDEWLTMAFSVPIENWGELAELAPKEVTLGQGKNSTPLELEFRPVTKGDTIERVMLLATDVSEQRRLEQTVQTQEEEYGRRIAAMRRLVAGGGQVFVAFIDSARERLQRCAALVGESPRTIPTAEIDELFRHVHTIKGEARAFDLGDLERETAKLEEDLDELRARALGEGFTTTGPLHADLNRRLRRAAEAIDRGCDVFVEASPIGRAALDQISVQRADVLAVLDLAPRTGMDALVQAASRLASRPFGETTASLVDAAPTWAAKEGKQAQMDVEGREVRIPPALAKVLGGVLTHLVRNAIAHGIEAPSVRESAGKQAIGTIHAEAIEGARGPMIVLEDDGHGLDLARIEGRARELGVVPIAGNVVELAFASGVSTSAAKDEFAGRGVGLSAVRADLASVGYSVVIQSEPGKLTRVVLEPRATTSSSPASSASGTKR